MVRCGSVCLRQRLSAAGCGGERASIVRADRFLGNPRVTVGALIAGWGERTARAVAGRHVLAVQDSSEIGLRTTASRRRGLGLVGCGNSHGLLLHAMLAVDADSGACLGLVSGQAWTRAGRVPARAVDRPLSEKESNRWGTTALAGKSVLSGATRVTVVGDRESDIYADWSRLPAAGFELLIRSQQDRRLTGGGRLHAIAADWPVAGTATIQVPAAPGTPGAKKGERPVTLVLRHGPVELQRPEPRYVAWRDPTLPATVAVHLVEVVESDPPPGVEPVHWRLLTTHVPATAAEAWRIVEWYKARWTIEQMFRRECPVSCVSEFYGSNIWYWRTCDDDLES
ncbi:IS4 family transposase [Thalassobaculum sp.]|uniref:IS4 family transposase n=1 Tax=Thalassobaculum sp. TaxID=2022740 RepID=UPI0032F0221F